MADRPRVGPADAETRRKKLREVLDAPTKAEGVAPKSMKEAIDAGVDAGTEAESDMLPNGKRRRSANKPKAKKQIVRRFGPKGETEEDMGL